MSDTVLQDIFIRAIAEERGWLDDRDREKVRATAIEIARNLLSLEIPLEKVVKATGLPREMVETLA